ncbi:hypothetical protein DDE01_11540 [Desulfovibrio desulfuricans]|nr:hypothetical protein DDE01_11540 [Desulfovibrio desulfuricans]
MSITTTLTWTRFDGTPETLPDNGVFVLLADKTKVREALLFAGYEDDNDMWAWGFGDSKPLEIGDLWAPWPVAPEAK